MKAEKDANATEINASYVMAGNCDQIPTAEDWTRWVNEASPEIVLKLRQHALGCLAQNVQDQRWGVLIGIAEMALKERCIEYQ